MRGRQANTERQSGKTRTENFVVRDQQRRRSSKEQMEPNRRNDTRAGEEYRERSRDQFSRGRLETSPARDTHREKNSANIQSKAREFLDQTIPPVSQIDAKKERVVTPPATRKAKSGSELQSGIKHLTPIEIINIFKRLDDDGSGDLSRPEFMKIVDDAHLASILIRQVRSSTESNAQACSRLFNEVDTDGSGEIDILELLRYYGHRHNPTRGCFSRRGTETKNLPSPSPHPKRHSPRRAD